METDYVCACQNYVDCIKTEPIQGFIINVSLQDLCLYGNPLDKSDYVAQNYNLIGEV